MATEALYTEFRKDGWPLCPACGEDELWSDYIPALTALDEPMDVRRQRYLDRIVGCLACGWKRPVVQNEDVAGSMP